MKRRELLKSAVLLPLVPSLHALADSPKHLWQGYDFGSDFPVKQRLDQGPFDIDQDEGWQTVLAQLHRRSLSAIQVLGFSAIRGRRAGRRWPCVKVDRR
jgi:hypothetical protein